MAHHAAGRLREAQAIYERLLRRLPNHPDLLDLYGTLRHQLGDHQQAAGFVVRSVAYRPAAAGAWNHLGSIRRALDQHGRAVAAFRRSALLAPSEPEPLINLGIVANDLRDHGQMVRVGRRALAVRPSLVEVRVKVGAALLALGRVPEAVSELTAIRRSHPLRADLALHLSSALAALGHQAAAQRAARAGIAASPAVHELYPRLVGIRDPKNDTGAYPAWSRYATCIRPRDARLWVNRAAELYRAGRFDAAYRQAMRAALLEPAHLAALQNMIAAAYQIAEYECGRRLAHRCLAAHPVTADVGYALAELELATGNLRHAWRLYEHRLARPRAAPRAALPPRWEGPGTECGRLLVAAEQGLGDELLFMSCLPDLLNDVVDPVVELDVRLHPLFRRSFPGIILVPRQSSRSDRGDVAFDYARVRRAHDITHGVLAGSLPGLYRAERDRPATRTRYLAPDADALAEWRKRLAALGPEPKVGVCWRSVMTTAVRSTYYAPLTVWEPLIGLPGIRFVSLQYDECRDELAAFRARTGIDVWRPDDLDQMNDLDATAALISALDAVVSAPTAVCMAAAALGVPTLRVAPSTYLIGKTHDHFFPTMRPLASWGRPMDLPRALALAAEILPATLDRGVAGPLQAKVTGGRTVTP